MVTEQPNHTRRRFLPSMEIVVLGLAAGLVLVTAIAISANVATHLEETATNEAATTVQAVVHAYVDPLLSADLFGSPDAQTVASVNHQLELLVGSGQIKRIKIWSPDGTVLFSDLPALRGQKFDVEEDLAEALHGEIHADVSTADAQENVFEHGLAPQLLEIYLPIANGGKFVGAYEIYQDATQLENAIAATRRDVFLISGGIGLVLLLALYASFRGSNRLLRQLAGRLRGSEARFRSLVQNSSDLIILLDGEGEVTYVSPAIGQILGLAGGDWTGRHLADLVHADDAALLRALIERLTSAGSPTADGELRLPHVDGRWRWVEVVGTNQLADADVGAIVLNCRDVSERRTLEDQLRHQAFQDPLTNLANRALLADRIEHELQSRRLAADGVLAVLLLDLDDFKTVNDSLGHTAGDGLLVAFADRLRATLRAGDTAARTGGDEFAILLRGRDRAEIETIAERVMSATRDQIAVGEHRLSFSASMGIAFAEGAVPSAEEILRSADVAMHLAKAGGKGVKVVYVPSMHAAAVRRLRMRADLEQALAATQLSLRYQPIVALATSEPIGVEALLRWDHPAGMVMPADFIPLAEETELIVPIGRWVLEEACHQTVAFDAIDPRGGLRVSVNVSPVQLRRPEFVAEVQDALRSSGLAPSRLTLEITESVLLDNADDAIAMMRKLRELGVRLAIDDFGTGYSSLSYLRDLPVDVLKIDRAFIAVLDQDSDAPEVVRSIIHLAGTLGMTTVAEGIERPEQVARLRSLGAEFGQGFLFARPLTEDQLADYLNSGEARAAS
jgi:diguanylate cyclase (GGDEF)-like protein/PAS domain S-box-containing protein